mmetsp:Transcript_44091/g.107139  ORF Transcript_44091/g.107139 Transcript_44091/m.107139 type:complete len:110 (-) Transcript_44091:871-1200(-)
MIHDQIACEHSVDYCILCSVVRTRKKLNAGLLQLWEALKVTGTTPSPGVPVFTEIGRQGETSHWHVSAVTMIISEPVMKWLKRSIVTGVFAFKVSVLRIRPETECISTA